MFWMSNLEIDWGEVFDRKSLSLHGVEARHILDLHPPLIETITLGVEDGEQEETW